MFYPSVFINFIIRLLRQLMTYIFNNVLICTIIVKNKKIKISQGVIIRNSSFDGINFVGRFSQLYNSTLGLYSYLGDGTIISNASIGKFCSIGPNVRVGPGIHPSSKFVTTSPYFYAKQDFKNFSFVDDNLFEQSKYSYIGNDVWIGCNVVVLDGVRIGDGAIIAAGTIVVDDVQPYSIVAGIPGKIIKKRFTDAQIEFISKVKWWDRDEIWLRRNAKFFVNIDNFLNNHE